MKPMKAYFYKSGLLSIITLSLVTILANPWLVSAQIIDPLREYTNPDEIVTFNKSTTYNEAIQIINTFAQEYENKFIVDKSAYSGPIGVTLPPMHWKDALNYIMRFQNLQLKEYDDYYEITVPEPKATTTAKSSSGGGQGQPQTTVVATTNTREVRINATFFEGNKRALREIGIDWSTLTNNIPANISDFVSGKSNESIPSTSFGDQFVAVNSFNAASVSQNAFNALVNLGEFGPGISVQALFSAFEADNLGKVLATPTIKVVDGEEGYIQVGQDFSIKQRDIAGNVTDNFVSTGTILTVTPQIITQGDTSFIYLDLEVERSTAQPDVVSTIVNKQEATTSAILLDGESTYVAGLYRTEETSVRKGIPILKDLPGWFFGLRYLFGYNSQDFLESELIIIVQAELIKPVSQRIAERRRTKREVLNASRDGMRTDLDRVFTTEAVPAVAANIPVNTVEVEGVAVEEDSIIVETETEEVAPDNIPPEEPEQKEELSEDQKELAEELSMPVDHPELMVVVPKAFDLNKFLEMQANGDEVETNETSGLKYFIIGGSFLVPNNAENFKNTLGQEGYESRILFNPRSRFNYVAYEGFADFKRAVNRTLEIRKTLNSEAWLFTLRSNKSQ